MATFSHNICGKSLGWTNFLAIFATFLSVHSCNPTKFAPLGIPNTELKTWRKWPKKRLQLAIHRGFYLSPTWTVLAEIL